MSFNVQGAKGLTIPEGTVKTIHDKDNRLLWGAVGYNTKYAGDAFQQTYSGKNLMPTLNTERTLAGVTFTPNPDGSITLNGTSTEATSYPISVDSATVTRTVRLEAGTYTLNGNYEDGYFTQLMYQPVGGGSNVYARATFTLTEPVMAGEYLRVREAGITFNNLRYYPQLEAGSTATDYEPYVGGTPAPNPDYPQDIQVVTGEQTVKVCGKNLFDINTLDNGTISVANGVATGTAAQFNSGFGNNTSGIMTPPTGQVTLSATAYTDADGRDDATGGLRISFRYSDGTNTATNWLNNTKTPVRKSITSDTGKTIDKIIITFLTGGANTWHISDFQIEKGSTATAYELYQSQSYEVNLGKNLIPTTDGTYTSQGLTYTVSNGVVTVNDTSSAVSTCDLTSTYPISLKAGETYTISMNNPVGSGTSSVSLRLMDTNNNPLTGTTVNANTGANASVSFTPTADVSGLRGQVRVASGVSLTNFVIKPMLEAGSTATSYAPYFPPIELCKIGTYQDYIWKDGDTWKVHKEVGKIVFTGASSESWSLYANNNAFYINKSDAIQMPSASDISLVCCDYYTATTLGPVYDGTLDYGIALGTANHRLNIRNKDTATVADFKTWLSTHNTTVYYALATPTDTAITDETLIAQLEAIDEWMTRYGYVGTVFGSLPIVIDRTTI